MRLQLDQFGKIKHFIHFGQAGILFLCWVLTIALLTRSGSTDGRVGWYFALCWLTIPILIYQVMVPMWSRARRFANVYAFASLDSFSVLLWLSAWAAVASYVSSGKGKGDNEGKSGCDNFKYGSPGRCKLSEAVIVFGVFEMVLFITTAFISFRAVMTFKRTGMMPENLPAGSSGMGGKNDFSAQTRDDFSSNMRNDDDDLEDHPGGGRQEYAYQKPSLDDAYAPIHQNDHDIDIAHLPAQTPTSPLNHSGLGIHDYDTSYNPGVYAGRGAQFQQPLAMPEPPR
ncbi:hypothetical protein A1O7_03132 [Cladophialophora yegresii CBS 114405]|uniref:MARVEL domain-containing protein n=1 Tax=Cladophialophora yegresii CBS 114405 TaxID=1182544 RepID=W9WWM0_9EURO|nr:uncharacterized protein A1O7_03132 [Cladophialophora yegresii CBS 114405]EXJ62694.1 hypothetical protein A1O7_03132 [Cladophialophora yegresii CBS 114405]